MISDHFPATLDELVKSQKTTFFVIPAKAGIQENQPLVDSRPSLRWGKLFAGVTAMETFYDTVKLECSKKRIIFLREKIH